MKVLHATAAAAAVAATMTLAMAGCSNPAINASASAASPAAGKSRSLPASCKKSHPVLAVALPNTVNPYYIAMRQSFLANGAKAGFDVKVAIADDSDATQLSQVQTFVQQGVCALALNGVNSGPAAAAVAMADRAGIPVFTVNVSVAANALKKQNAAFIQYVGADQVEGGKVMGQAVLKDLGANTKIVAGIGGDPAQIPTNQRDQGFKSALNADPNASVAATVNTQVDPNVSLQVISEMLQGNPKINVVFADTGPAAVGAIQAIKQLGKTGKVSLYAFCAANTALNNTLYRGCAAQEPALYAQMIVTNVKSYLVGHPVEKNVLVPVKVFTEGQKPGPGLVG
jgi:ribose transport system substrate-binding protein